MSKYPNFPFVVDLYGLREAFKPIPDSDDNSVLINKVYESARNFSNIIITEIPASYERDKAIESLRVSVLWLHSAIKK